MGGSVVTVEKSLKNPFLLGLSIKNWDSWNIAVLASMDYGLKING